MIATMALFAVARLETFKHDSKARVTSLLATATGFFYRNKEDKVFLITNKHVLYDRDRHYFPDWLRFHVHSDLNHLTKTKHIDLRLWGKGGKRLWKWVPHRPIDVAALEVPANQLADCRFINFSQEDMLKDQLLPGKDIDLGLQALVVGYPLDFYDKNTLLPMARGAIVATWPWLNFEGKPCFLVDARLHPGMSGSPVISSPGTVCRKQNSKGVEEVANKKETYLLGVFSDERTPWGEPIGLNTVWHASIIRDMVGD
ncbi:MAG: trypsin-like peptidase domain-containing protein [Chloroflexi bacterium]|nr:trypsin-like peptidase domain-containing protein [Chloroflexota bacterium]